MKKVLDYHHLVKVFFKKPMVFLYFQMLPSLFSVAQNSSYSTNSIPIGGTFSTAFGSGSLQVNTGAGNSAAGYRSLYANTSGKLNTATGYLALFTNTTGNYNSATGSAALYRNTTGYHNTANGYNALYSNTTGIYNTAAGSLSLNKNTTGSHNAANGYSALYNNTTGVYNTAAGSLALYFNSTGGDNTAVGYQSLYNNTTGNNNTANGYQSLFTNQVGRDNTAYGFQSMYLNNGIRNTASGYQSLFNNNDGGDNVATGYRALYSNVIGFQNTANGAHALNANVDGFDNSATGYQSLFSNINGVHNTATGTQAMFLNSGGSYNTANGVHSLYNNTSGIDNTAIGDAALYSNTTGNNNTALGYAADVSAGNLFNATAIGVGAIVNASNKVRIGNTSVSSIGGQVGWTIFSDGRVKKNIQDDVPGLAFINLLKPVTYNYNVAKEDELLRGDLKEQQQYKMKSNDQLEGKYDVEKIKFSGFVAQDVEAAAKKIGYEFSGIDNTGNIMGLRYSDFVVPLVKAVQELQQQVDELKKALATKDAVAIGTIDLNNNAVALDQNVPNPFVNQTMINYNVPQQARKAALLFYDASGKMIASYELKNKGKGQLAVFGEQLSSGTYTYSLVVDGKVAGSKKIVKE